MTHLLQKELRLWHIEATLSVSTKQKQQSSKQIEKIVTMKETKTKRLSESMVSVNDDCQGRELKQTNCEIMKQVPSSVVFLLTLT